MDISRRLRAPGPYERLFEHVEDLSRYPRWMDLVHDVEPVEPTDGESGAWEVELRAKVGPLARSKRLRMARTEHAPPSLVVFERRELDGRTHAPWILRAEVAALDDGGDDLELTMHLHYGGSLWTGAVLERVLESHVERGSTQLLELLSGPPSTP